MPNSSLARGIARCRRRSIPTRSRRKPLASAGRPPAGCTGERIGAMSPTPRPGGHGTLITVAPTGAELAKADVPNLPVTLEELVATARDCERVGAAMIHVHIRGADTRPTLDLQRLKDTVAALREQTDLIVQLSTGGAVTDPEDDRLAVLDAMPDSASCTMGTVNFGDDVFMNRWEFVVELHNRMRERGIVPEYEIFDLGRLATLHRLLDQYGPPAGGQVHVDLVMGVPGGMPGDTETLVAALRL